MSPYTVCLWLHLGQTQLICFSEPPVHWSLEKVWKKVWNKKSYLKNRQFWMQFLPVFLLFFIPLAPLKWVWERNNKSIKCGLMSYLITVVIPPNKHAEIWPNVLWHMIYCASNITKSFVQVLCEVIVCPLDRDC